MEDSGRKKKSRKTKKRCSVCDSTDGIAENKDGLAFCTDCKEIGNEEVPSENKHRKKKHKKKHRKNSNSAEVPQAALEGEEVKESAAKENTDDKQEPNPIPDEKPKHRKKHRRSSNSEAKGADLDTKDKEQETPSPTPEPASASEAPKPEEAEGVGETKHHKKKRRHSKKSEASPEEKATEEKAAEPTEPVKKEEAGQEKPTHVVNPANEENTEKLNIEVEKYKSLMERKDEEIKDLNEEIEKIRAKFFDQNKLLKSSDRVKEMFSVMKCMNDELKKKTELSKEQTSAIVILHHNTVHELRKLIHEKNLRLQKFSEHYPEISEGIFLDSAGCDASEFKELEEKLSKTESERAKWINKYNELLQINDNLRKKIDEMFTEDLNDKMPSSEGDEEDSEEESEEKDNEDEEEDEEEAENSELASQKSWLPSFW